MFSIAKYNELYRPYDKSGGELKHPDFVKLPANPKGDGLQKLLEYKRGLEIFGIWCLLLEKTTIEKPENRGKLLNHKEESATPEEIAKGISLKSKIGLVGYALSVLVAMGWVVTSEPTEQTSGKVPLKISKDKISKDKLREDKTRFLDFVFLTNEEHTKLEKKLGTHRTANLIEELNNGIGSKGYKYKSHYHTILAWARRKDEKTNTQAAAAVDTCIVCRQPIHKFQYQNSQYGSKKVGLCKDCYNALRSAGVSQWGNLSKAAIEKLVLAHKPKGKPPNPGNVPLPQMRIVEGEKDFNQARNTERQKLGIK